MKNLSLVLGRLVNNNMRLPIHASDYELIDISVIIFYEMHISVIIFYEMHPTYSSGTDFPSAFPVATIIFCFSNASFGFCSSELKCKYIFLSHVPPNCRSLKLYSYIECTISQNYFVI